MADGSLALAFPRVEHATPHRFTFDDIMRMQEAGLIDGDARFELIDGEIIDMPAEGEPHLNYKIELNRSFVRNAPDNVRIAPDATLMLSQRNAPEPDLYVFESGSPTHPIDVARLHLVIEIADSSLDRDVELKRDLYARHGIIEYWVVDVNARTTHVFRHPLEGAYPPSMPVGFGEVLSPFRLPELKLQISSLPHVG